MDDNESCRLRDFLRLIINLGYKWASYRKSKPYLFVIFYKPIVILQQKCIHEYVKSENLVAYLIHRGPAEPNHSVYI